MRIGGYVQYHTDRYNNTWGILMATACNLFVFLHLRITNQKHVLYKSFDFGLYTGAIVTA